MEETLLRIVYDVPERLFREKPAPFKDAYARRCFRVLRMVGVLHGKGFHGLRVLPYEYPLAYRIELYPARYADTDGVKYRSELIDAQPNRRHLVARHSGASDEQYFGWEDVAGVDAHDLALEFLKRFPDLARESFGLDYAYAGWFSTLLQVCEYGFLPYRYAEYEEEGRALHLRSLGDTKMDWFPLPPSPSHGSRLRPSGELPWLRS
jgi:hypothetical protein